MVVGEVITEIVFEEKEGHPFYGMFRIRQTAKFRGHEKMGKEVQFDSRLLLSLLDSGYLTKMLNTHKDEIKNLCDKGGI